jgi:hypothetical protein
VGIKQAQSVMKDYFIKFEASMETVWKEVSSANQPFRKLSLSPLSGFDVTSDVWVQNQAIGPRELSL